MNDYAWLFISAGIAMGPFIGAAAVAWPRHPRLVGKSQCAGCGAAIQLYRQIPVLTYVITGRDRGCCSGKIPRTYFWAELFSPMAGFAAALHPMSEAVFLFFMVQALLYAALVDARRFVVPAEALLLFTGTALLQAYWDGGIVGVTGALAAGAPILGIMAPVALIAWKRRALGLGDFLLLAALAIALGWREATVVTALAAAGLLVWSRLKPARRLPFAPSLATAGSLFLTAPWISGFLNSTP
jgi:prepilin signal peptidase PulO-like enzyme (type II secretory pathway)